MHNSEKNKQTKKKKKKKNTIENVVPFQDGGKITIFVSSHFDFGQNLKKKKLSQRNFSMKFGSK